MVLGGLGRSNAVHGDTAHLLPLEAETGRRLVERSLPRRSRRELRVEEHVGSKPPKPFTIFGKPSVDQYM